MKTNRPISTKIPFAAIFRICMVCTLALALMLAQFAIPEAAPEPTEQPFAEDKLKADQAYYITVDISNQVVTVYRDEDKTMGGIVRQMICSTGMGGATPRGLFALQDKYYQTERTEWYYFADFQVWAKYATRIYGNYLFHSTLYGYKGSTTPTWASNHSLGSQASHGCVRLREEDAKWIAENCDPGTHVYIFEGAERDSALRSCLLDSSFDSEKMTYEKFRSGENAISSRSDKKLIEKAQKALKELGYYDDDVDGKIGPKSRAAISAWQKDNGFEETERVEADQIEALLGEQVTSDTAPEIDLAQPAATPVLKKGFRYVGISDLQGALKRLGYKPGKSREKFDDATEKAVKEWQSDNGLEPTGELTYADYERIMALSPDPNTAITEETTWSEGSEHKKVYKIQEKLNELGYKCSADGDFGPGTTEALKAWQTDNGYEADGVLTYTQYNRLMGMRKSASPEA